MKVYIAGPMSGLPERNYPAFNRATEQLARIGFEPLNPATVDNGGQQRDWQWYMRRSLAMMLTADRVALLPGWENSRGARIEAQLADDLDIPITPIEHLLHTDEVTS